MRPYHPSNLNYLPHSGWRLIALAWAGKLLGIQFHVHGIPFGAPYRPEVDGLLEAALEGDGG